MANFKVTYPNGDTESYSGESAVGEVDPATGVLTVMDGNGKRLRFSPNAWLCVEDGQIESAYVHRIYEHEGGAEH